MTPLSKKILTLLAADRGAAMEAGRKARAIAFDLEEKKQLVVDGLVELADHGLVAIWRPFADDVARYRISDAGRALCLPSPTVAAALAAVLWCALVTYGFPRPVSATTASLVAWAKGAAIHADHPGRVRQALTPYQSSLAAERDLWLRPLEEIS